MVKDADTLLLTKKKSNKSNFGTTKYEKTINCNAICHTKDSEVRELFCMRIWHNSFILEGLSVIGDLSKSK